jgi:hypothetical protein
LPPYTPAEAEGRRRNNAKRSVRRRREFTQWIAEIKLARGCADCGYRDHPEALHFDHLPGFSKDSGIARLFGRSRAAILAEIAKCEVVCANCHAVRTWARRQEAPAS